MGVIGSEVDQEKTCKNDFQTSVDSALEYLRLDGVVAFATDTLYGLGADVFSQPALERVFSIKGRPEGQPLPVLVSGWDQVEMVAAGVPPKAERLARRFWPGGLTLILRSLPEVPMLLTGGGGTVAVRMPNHRVPLALAAGLGSPITGTSANLSGHADIENLKSLESKLGDRVDFLVKAGPAPQGVASTIVDITSCEPRLLREGAVPFLRVLET